MILRELLTQRQSRMVLLAYGGGGEGGLRGEERPVGGGEFGSLSFFPYLFFLRLPLSQSVFFCFMRAAVKTGYTAHLTFAVADSTRQSLLLHKADFRCATTSTFKNCA